MTLEPEYLVGLTAIILIFGGPLIGGVVYMICQSWVRVTNHEKDVELKHRLLDAGMTAAEIVEVMNAGSENGRDTECGPVKRSSAEEMPQTIIGSPA